MFTLARPFAIVTFLVLTMKAYQMKKEACIAELGEVIDRVKAMDSPEVVLKLVNMPQNRDLMLSWCSSILIKDICQQRLLTDQ